MYYQNYEDYMRQVLGYPMSDPNIYEPYDYRNMPDYSDTYSDRNQYVTDSLSEEEIRRLYPEVYNLVNPMVNKVFAANTQPITKELIEAMTDEVYFAVEDTSTVVNVRVETKKPENTNNSSTRKSESSTDRTSKREEVRTERTPRKEESSREVGLESASNRENRQINRSLRDLIQILILNQILGGIRPPIVVPRPPIFPPRPPMPPRPPRPPMGPGPGRPPIQPRGDYSDYLKF